MNCYILETFMYTFVAIFVESYVIFARIATLNGPVCEHVRN